MLYREHAGALNAWKVEKSMLEKKVGRELELKVCVLTI